MTKPSKQKDPEIDLDIKAILGTAHISYEQFLNLQMDDLLILDQDIDSSMNLVIEGKKKFTGIPGVFEQKRALKINGDPDG